MSEDIDLSGLNTVQVKTAWPSAVYGAGEDTKTAVRVTEEWFTEGIPPPFTGRLTAKGDFIYGGAGASSGTCLMHPAQKGDWLVAVAGNVYIGVYTDTALKNCFKIMKDEVSSV